MYRFVIGYIENGLKSPIFLNEKVSTVARACLMLSYVVIDAPEKLKSILSSINDHDQSLFQNSFWGCIWKTVEKCDYLSNPTVWNKDKRTSFFILSLKKLQQRDNPAACNSQVKVCNVLNRPSGSNKRSTSKICLKR